MAACLKNLLSAVIMILDNVETITININTTQVSVGGMGILLHTRQIVSQNRLGLHRSGQILLYATACS
jgi:hypothetical protein